MYGLINGNAPNGAFPDEALYAYLDIDLYQSAATRGKATGNLILRKYSESEASIQFKDVKVYNTNFFDGNLVEQDLSLHPFLPRRETILPLIANIYVDRTTTVNNLGYVFLATDADTYGRGINCGNLQGNSHFIRIYDTIIHYRLD